MEGVVSPVLGAGEPIKFSLSYYNLYETPYTINSVTGRYAGIMRAQNEGDQITVDVAQDGSINASLSTCTLTGKIAQKSPSQNPYEFAIAFSGPRCAFGQDQASGVMMVEPLQSGGVLLRFYGSNAQTNKFFHMTLEQTSANAGVFKSPF
jgi:hypothetical protein